MNGNLKQDVKGSVFIARLSLPIYLFRNKGFTYMAAMVLVVIIGIALSMTGKYWSTVAKREKEEELLFRGDQIKKGIEAYYKSTARITGKGAYPESLEVLVKSGQNAKPGRYLRKIYKDPVTGKADWAIFSDPASKSIMGIRSASNDEPLKVSNFPFVYKDFEGKTKYSDWVFVYRPQPHASGQPRK